jgi:hypothetical protein
VTLHRVVAGVEKAAIDVRETSSSRPNSVEYGEAFKLGQCLCIVTMLFASGDIWPTVSLGFTFRLSQLTLVFAAGALLLQLRRSPLLLFPGWNWLCAFALWTVVCLPWSLYLDRSLGYVSFCLLDILLVLVFVQYFRTEKQLRLLVAAMLWSFIAIATFGLVQLAAGLLGIDLLAQEWWIPGRWPRINGISYEPSYFTTYLTPGVVLSAYLLRTRSPVVPRRVLLACLVLCIGTVILSTSRLGMTILLAWWLVTASWRAIQWVRNPRFGRKLVLKMSLVGVIVVASTVVLIRNSEKISDAVATLGFLGSGITLPGEGGGSSDTRLRELTMTFNAFLSHPIMGTGLGALPVVVGEQKGVVVQSIGDAKANEGMSIFVELVASTGIVGGVLVLGFGYQVFKALMVATRSLPTWRRDLACGSAWALLWIVVALQFNQNFLRLYLFLDIAVVICCIRVPPPAGAGEAQAKGRLAR